MAKTKTSSAVKQRYNEKAYDRLAITVPKGQKRAIQEHAEMSGQSINGLVNSLLQADMKLSEDEWRNPTVQDE